MKKGFGMMEIIISMILILVISNMVVGLSYIKKSEAIQEFNTNMNIEIDNKLANSKKLCKGLINSSCSAIGGSGSDVNCTFKYTIVDMYNKNREINTICEKTTQYLVNTKVSMFVDQFEFKGESNVAN